VLDLVKVNFLGDVLLELVDLGEEDCLFAGATGCGLERLQSHDRIEQVVGLCDLRTDFGIGVLAKGCWWVISLVHVLRDILQEEIGGEEGRLLR